MTGKEAYEAYAVREYGLHRSCVWAHLDDFSILFDGRAARYYASKGQQKLMLFLFKLSQASLIKEQAQQGVVLLIDDFLSDFDNQRLDETLELARSVGTQLLITSPQSGSGGLLKERIMGYNAHIITL
jgi:DNA replication and repair protein RecF